MAADVARDTATVGAPFPNAVRLRNARQGKASLSVSLTINYRQKCLATPCVGEVAKLARLCAVQEVAQYTPRIG